MFWPLINSVETGKTPEYPDIQPCLYSIPIDQAYNATHGVLQSLSRWRVVQVDKQNGMIGVEATSLFFRFIDDITIKIDEIKGKSRIHARSVSRVGKWDFGQNARNLRLFFRSMEKYLEDHQANEREKTL